MSQLESLREKLYSVLGKGNYNDILKISQELDRIILTYYEGKQRNEKMSA